MIAWPASSKIGLMAWLTVTEAAAHYSLSGSQIRRVLASGVVEGRKVGPLWTVEEGSLKRYLASERKPGPSPKTR